MKIIRKKLKSGLRLIMVPTKDSPTVTALVMVEAGSKYETKSQNGISHFLEHMCFKGTRRRPRSLDISHELDALGAESNAFTSFEYTGYYAKASSKHVGPLIDVVSDIYLNPQFPKEEIEKEKGVILEEMHMYEDLPQRKVQEVFTSLLYGNQPAGWTILGEKDVIRNAKQKDFINYRKDHYVASATVVILAGNFDTRKATLLVENAFKDIPRGPKKGKKKVVEKQQKPALLVFKKNTDQTHIVLGFRGFSVGDKRGPALHVLNALLGSGMSSRLFQKLREEMGVGYYVRSGIDELSDHGFLAISTGVDKTRLEEVVQAIIDLVKECKNTLPSKVELEKAKESMIGGFLMGLESSDSVAMFVADQEILKRKVESPQEIEKKIRKVTAKQVQDVASQVFSNENLNLAVVGDVGDVSRIQKILKL